MERDTLQEAKDLFKRVKKTDGMDCPCCGRWGKDNRPSLSSAMVKALFIFWRYRKDDPDGWVNYTKSLKNSINNAETMAGSYGGLKYWGLIEQKPNDTDPTKKTSGLWRITEKGKRFVLGRIKVPKYVTIFDDEVLDCSGPDVSIQDCLPDNFNYAELMARPGFAPDAKDDDLGGDPGQLALL